MIVRDSWESKNQARRYPLRETEGEYEPFGYLVDMNIILYDVSIDKEDVWLSSIFVGNGKISININNGQDSLIKIIGTSAATVDFGNDQVVGAVTFGEFSDDTSLRMELTQQEGLFELGIVKSKIFVNSTISVSGNKLSGVVDLVGKNGITAEAKEYQLPGGVETVIYLDYSNRLNRAAIPDCAAVPEEYWARQVRQGILSVGGNYADYYGNITLSISGEASYVENNYYLTTIDDDRETVCALGWRLREPITIRKTKCEPF